MESPYKIVFFILLNVGLLLFSLHLISKKNLLSYAMGGKWWLTWLSVGVITLMDELTSIFYAPSEAYAALGLKALIFLPLTAIFIRYLTTRMVEIAEILDVHNLRGGGVYNFSYLVLGPVISFVAVSSIFIVYVLTAAISSVSAVENVGFYFELGTTTKVIIEIVLIWLVAILNISGIRNNAKITFIIFVVTAFVFLNIIGASFFNLGPENWNILHSTGISTFNEFKSSGFFGGYGFLVVGLSSCILAYSGVESVLQTASLVPDWKEIKRAYLFLALSVGIVTPIISLIVLSSPHINFKEHSTDLMMHFTFTNLGPLLGIPLIVVASLTLFMATNTAFVASSELLERVAHRYNFNWIIETNRNASLYRIHICSAIFFSLIVVITQGQQHALAHMYAVGLLASFMIQLTCLLIYRYSKGTKEVLSYNVSRTGTLVLLVFTAGSFAYLSFYRPDGFILWAVVSALFLAIGVYGTKRRAPELVQLQKGESPMDIIFYLAEANDPNVHLYFKRPFDTSQEKTYGHSVFITFYSPRQPIPPRLGENHFRIPFKRAPVHHNTLAILELVLYEMPEKNITVHFGWPTSSWFDRLSTGVMVFQFMGLPKQYPHVNFKIESFSNRGGKSSKD